MHHYPKTTNHVILLFTQTTAFHLKFKLLFLFTTYQHSLLISVMLCEVWQKRTVCALDIFCLIVLKSSLVGVDLFTIQAPKRELLFILFLTFLFNKHPL